MGLDPATLKTSNLQVDTRYNYSSLPDGSSKSVFEGYECSHLLKIEFDLDTQLLSKLLSALSKTQATPEFRISYGVKDKEGVSEALLASIVADARRKAEILTKAAGVTLRSIRSIDYSWQDVVFRSGSSAKMMAMAPSDAPFELDIEPEDLRIEDSATIIWDIT